MNRSVYLSPSTQKENIGVGDYGNECFRMNEVCDFTEKVLIRHGITVYRNRPEMTLGQVVTDSDKKKPEIHFAIHSNGGGGRGCEVYYHRFGGEGERLARAVYDELSPITPTGDRGVKVGYNFYGTGKHMYELANTNAPAALAEVAFHDSPDDAEWIISNIEEIGTALAKGILKYFNIPYIADNSNLNAEINLLHKVGIIQSPEYWKENAVKGKTIKGENAAILIQRVAAFIMKEAK